MSVRNQVSFAQIPEWILDAPISANAVRLYAVLNRHADKASNEATPSRRRLAERCRISSATVDRAMKELVDLGAIRVTRRKSEDGDWTSNSYLVLQSRGEVSSPVSRPPLTSDETGPPTGDETVPPPVMNKREPFEREPFERESLLRSDGLPANAGDDVGEDQVEAKPSGRLNHDQRYLLEHLHRRGSGWRSASFGFIGRLNQTYGPGRVTEALRTAAAGRELVDNGAGYLQGILLEDPVELPKAAAG